LQLTNPIKAEIETSSQVRDAVLEAAELIPAEPLGTTGDCGFSLCAWRCFRESSEPRSREHTWLTQLRGQLADIVSGAVLVFVALAVCGIATMRRRSGVRVLL